MKIKSWSPLDIKVGDYVNIPQKYLKGTETKSHLQSIDWPIRVESIGICSIRDDDECYNCPGYINTNCFGYGIKAKERNVLTLYKISEWNTEEN